MLPKARVEEVRLGSVRVFGPNGEPSAYKKSPIEGPVEVHELGLAGDSQADLENHGGVDKAILHYAFDHYEQWREDKVELARKFDTAGAFGENISTLGITESEVCIGDRFRLGTAIVEVSQGRQPCWKLGHSFGNQEMVREVIRTGRSGWYYRVVQVGAVAAGDTIELLERLYEQWNVERVFGLLIGDDRDPEAIEQLSDLEVLSENWRKRAQRLHANIRR